VYLLEYLQGRLSKEEAIERTEIGTWHLARKQRTWARNIGWEFSDEQQARGIAERFFAGV
jgi:tRNA A37 N6-isopentenylltransferase MiaA